MVQVNRRAFVIGGAAIAAAAVGAGVALWRPGRNAARDGAAVLAMVLPDADGREQALAQ